MNEEIAKIGEGIYTAADISRIFKIPYPKIKYWFRYYIRNKLFHTIGYRYYFPIKDTIAVNFLTLIEMYVFYTLKEKGIKMSDIIKIHTQMSKYLHTPYPFASQEFYISGKQVYFEQDNILIEASDTYQEFIPSFVNQFVERIKFDDKRLARKFYPLGKDKSVVLNPENQCGQPTIDGTNILTATLFEYYKGKESIETIARLFDLSVENVRDAIEFHRAA